MRCTRRLFTALVGLTLVTPAFSADAKIKEAATGREFDAQVTGAEAGRVLVCTGTACRQKYFIAVNVYAIAHWIDAKAAGPALQKWKGQKGAALAEDQAFYDALCAADVEKRLRLSFVRDVAVDKIREAFSEGLKTTYPTFPPYVERFLKAFSKDLVSGDSYELRCLPGGHLEVYQNDKKVDQFPNDKAFGAAVWKIWFQKELSEDKLVVVKKNLVGRIEAIW